jgi:hypothetical protein
MLHVPLSEDVFRPYPPEDVSTLREVAHRHKRRIAALAFPPEKADHDRMTFEGPSRRVLCEPLEQPAERALPAGAEAAEPGPEPAERRPDPVASIASRD